jgi:hypothetical protein
MIESIDINQIKYLLDCILGNNLSTKIINFVILAAMLYPMILYLLPPKLARKLKPIGKILTSIANTPGGFKINKRR